MKKRALALLLITALTFAMTGCGGGSGTSEKTSAETIEEKKEEQSPVNPGEGGEQDGQEAEEKQKQDTPSQEPSEDGSEAQNSVYEELVPLMSHEEFEEAKAGSPVTIESYVQVKDAFDTKQSAVSLYAQDEEGAYLIPDLPITQKEFDSLEIGQKIRISGYKDEEAGDTRIVNATGMTVDGSYVAETEDVTDLLGKDGLTAFKDHLVSFKGLKSVDTEDAGGDLLRFFYGPDGNGGPGDDLYFTAEKDGTAYLFKVESDLCGPGTDIYDKVTYVEEDAVIDLEGILYDTEEGIPMITNMTILE